MKTKYLASLVAAPLLAISSMASAAEPVQLTASEMDGVSAGVFFASGISIANAVGAVAAATATANTATVGVIAVFPVGLAGVPYVGSLSTAASSSSSL